MNADLERDLLIEEAYRAGYEGRELSLHLALFERYYEEGRIASQYPEENP